MDTILETNSSFHVKCGTTGKAQFLFFRKFLLVLKKFSSWEEIWALSYNPVKFWDFPNISYFSKILESFGNLWGNSYIPCLLLITAPLFTRKTWSKIKKSQNIMIIIVGKFSRSEEFSKINPSEVIPCSKSIVRYLWTFFASLLEKVSKYHDHYCR